MPTATFDSAVCTSSGNCTVTGSVSGSNGRNATAFTNIVTWMQKYDPAIQPANVTISYKNVGLGFAGDPNGPDVAALTTVTVSGMTFKPAVLFGGSFTLPSVEAKLTLEDAQGTDSN